MDDPSSSTWIESELKTSTEKWKIVFLPSSALFVGRRHGSEVKLRAVLEPLFRSTVSSRPLN